jgi:hypothetical protein
MDIREQFLKGFETVSQRNIDIANIYRHLFSCMEHDSLKQELEYLQERIDKDPEGWFHDLHKSMRQTDFFGSLYLHYNVDEQTAEDIEEIENIKKILPKYSEKSMSGIVNSQEVKELGLDKEYARYMSLKRKKSVVKTRNISGHIDMVLWNMIHLDKEDFLKKYIENFYKQLLIEKL